MEDKDLSLEEVESTSDLIEVEETKTKEETKEIDTVDNVEEVTDKNETETEDKETVEETKDTPEPNEVPLYLVIEEDGKVVDLSFEDGVFYQNVSEDIDIELVKSELGIGDNLYWDGYLYVKEIDWKEENDILKQEIKALQQTIVAERKNNETQMLEIMELMMGML